MHIKIYVILCKINKTKKGFAERSLKLENTDPCVFLIKEINHVQFISLKKIMARFFNKNPSSTFLLTIELLYIVIPFKKHRTGEDFIDTLYNKCESNGNNWRISTKPQWTNQNTPGLDFIQDLKRCVNVAIHQTFL